MAVGPVPKRKKRKLSIQTQPPEVPAMPYMIERSVNGGAWEVCCRMSSDQCRASILDRMKTEASGKVTQYRTAGIE